jgi:glycosyltransferase involved in cell wall biosynthesis
MQPLASIVISSHNRLGLFRRVLWAIANRGPSDPFEVVVVDDGSTEDVLGELKQYSSRFEWTLVRFNAKEFEAATGLKKEWNNPCVTNNIGLKHARGSLIYQQGNEVIPVGDVYDRLKLDIPLAAGCEIAPPAHWMVMSTTYDVPRQVLDRLDPFGSNLTDAVVRECHPWPLQSRAYRSDVTNYISLAPRACGRPWAGTTSGTTPASRPRTPTSSGGPGPSPTSRWPFPMA